MEIMLRPEFETMIRERLESGNYETAAAVVEEGLLLLAEQEEHQRKYEALKRDIQAGIDQLDSGAYLEYSSGDELLEDIRMRGDARLKARRDGAGL